MERAAGVEPALFLVGSQAPCRLGDARIVKERWRPWLESNQQDAVLETAPAPLPHGLGVTDGIRTRVVLPHKQAPSLSTTATAHWGLAPESNRPPCATRARCSLSYEAMEGLARIELAASALPKQRSAS
jgi:hypothetical protein